MTAVFCRNALDRKADTWAEQRAPFERLGFAISDAAQGIAKAVGPVAAARHDDPKAPTLEHGLDVFHTAMEAHRVRAQHGRRAEAVGERAEAADGKVADAKLPGLDARGWAQTARAAWRQATTRFEQVQLREAAWGRVPAALEVFRADGRLHDRAHAQAEIAAARVDLPGPEWAKVRNFLDDPRGLTFLDRMHRRLESAAPRRAWREAMTWRWWRRHHRPTPTDPQVALVQAIACDGPLTGEEAASYARVAAVRQDTVRARSAVECMNSVLRMPQSRHRRMTQPMRDLKRLYGNCHRFRTGPRQDNCPYKALGLMLPTYDFWELLHTDPARLTQELSTQGNTG